MRARPCRPAALVLTGAALAACSHGASPRPAAATNPAAAPPAAPVVSVTLPPDPLAALVPAPGEVPAGMLPLLKASGPRDAHDIAAFSADPKQAGTALHKHHFQRAYVAQYADPATGRVLSAVVSQFGDATGAAADYRGDTAASGGAPVLEPTIGDASDVRTQPLPGTGPSGSPSGQLVTVRFRLGDRTWLVAFGARPTASPDVPVALARQLAARARAT